MVFVTHRTSLHHNEKQLKDWRRLQGQCSKNTLICDVSARCLQLETREQLSLMVNLWFKLLIEISDTAQGPRVQYRCALWQHNKQTMQYGFIIIKNVKKNKVLWQTCSYFLVNIGNIWEVHDPTSDETNDSTCAATSKAPLDTTGPVTQVPQVTWQCFLTGKAKSVAQWDLNGSEVFGHVPWTLNQIWIWAIFRPSWRLKLFSALVDRDHRDIYIYIHTHTHVKIMRVVQYWD